MRRLSIPRPFTGGYKTDLPDYALALNEASYAQDMVAPLGIARQRWGWSYTGPTVTAGSAPFSVAKSYFALPGTTMMTVAHANGMVYANPSGSASWNIVSSVPSAYPADTKWLPRCVYNGEMIFCAQDGVTPLMRYAGPSTYGGLMSSSGTVSIAAGSMTLTLAGTVGSDAPIGQFINFRAPSSSGGFSKNPTMSARILSSSGSTVTVDSLRNKTTSSASSTVSYFVIPTGYAYPCVVVNETGKISSMSGTTVNFEGTKHLSGPVTPQAVFPANDALLIENTTIGSPHEIADINSVVNDTRLTTHVALTSFTNAAFKVLRRCPFKDATVHRGSLWGTGVKQYPNRVYVFIPTKDIGLPPAAEKPFDPTLQAGYASTNVQGFTRVSDFLAGAYDVPGPYDSTPVVAILSSAGPLLALKSDSVYGLYGTYDATNPTSIEVSRISDGAGCIDIRSAVTIESIPFWAGQDGIFSYRNSQIINLTDGRIQREWQALMKGYVTGTSCVAVGLVGTSYLVVSCTGLDSTKTGGAKNGPDTSNPSSRTLVYDLRLNVWLGRMSNFDPIHMWSASVEDGGDALLAVESSETTIIDFAPALSGGNVSDSNTGTLPRFKVWSTASLAQADGVEGEARFCDVVVHANLLDTSTPTSTFDISIVSGGSLDDQTSSTKTLSPITADTADRVDRHKRTVNRSGRLHQIRLDMSMTDTSNVKSEIPEVVMSFRDTRRGT